MAMNHEPVAAPMDASLESIVDNQKVYPACPVPFEKVEVDHQTWPKYGYSKVIKLFGTKRVAWCAGEDLGAWHSFRHWLEIVDENGNFIVRGDTTIYESLARLEDEGQLFIAGTAYWDGSMPHEQPLLVQTGN
jgi:hypothetical protein